MLKTLRGELFTGFLLKSLLKVWKTGAITLCINHLLPKNSENIKVFPDFHRVFNRLKKVCNIQHLSTPLNFG